MVSRVFRCAIAALCVGTFTAVAPIGAIANDCAKRCYAEENACRRDTKDSPSCGSQLTRCLQSCRAKR